MRKRFSGDVYLVLLILVGLFLRLHKLDAPITDADSFRQGATASIARNYHEGGYGLLDPRITGWGTLNEPGLWPNEFPLYPYVVGKLYALTGEHEWVGRLITILFCLAGAVGLYDLVRRWEGVLAARFAAFWFLLAPQFIYHGRCFHRHPVAIGLMLLALAAYARRLDAKTLGSWLMMTICGGLALLLMPPLITIAPLVLWMYVQSHDWRIWKERSLLLSVVLMLIPSILWYGWAMQQPQSYSLNSWGRDTFRNWTSLSYYTLWWKYDFFRQVWRGLWYYTLGPVGALFGVLGVFLRRGRIPSLALVWTGTILVYYFIDIHPIAVAPH
ncbi:MAG: ArnT family glycosyltransferase, partial [Candidatus Hinthialibacter sp.]